VLTLGEEGRAVRVMVTATIAPDPVETTADLPGTDPSVANPGGR